MSKMVSLAHFNSIRLKFKSYSTFYFSKVYVLTPTFKATDSLIVRSASIARLSAIFNLLHESDNDHRNFWNTEDSSLKIGVLYYSIISALQEHLPKLRRRLIKNGFEKHVFFFVKNLKI